MQHLDEGIIHAWLDGALTPDEATRVEAHVNECPQCQVAVAEARGFIAASSRILTALDDAPRGVIPASLPKRRVQPWVWRVAATVVVVATGTILLARGRTTTQYSETSSRVPVSEARAGRTGEATAAAAAAADSVSIGGATLSQQNAAPAAAAPATTSAPTQRAMPRTFSPAPTPAPARTGLDRDESALETRNGARLDESRERVASKIAAAPTAPVAQALPVNGAVAFESGTNIAPRQVQTKRVIGGTQTLYELAPGDTVVLEEQSSSELQNVVVTAVPAAAGAARRAQPSTLSGRTAGVAAPQQKTEAAVPPPHPAVAPLEDAQVMEVHRISWLDPSSGRVLILSGRHSQDELQAIRKKIQQLRDAAAASKKLPD
ncbi:MAG TPA: zf-HC2 domain-containing protein [Gemmatimonadaceae bacterium]|nr:zf-HC2 domain-containing protein [Gemmatimonadaceae bacterium]